MILGMIKKICLVFIFTILPNISNSIEKIDLQKQIQSYSWNKRIVLFITMAKYVYFINEVDFFLINIIAKIKKEIWNISKLLVLK